MKKRVLAVILLITIVIVGCGKMDGKSAKSTSDKKEEMQVEKEVIDEEDIVSGEEDKGTSEECAEEAVEEEVASETILIEQVQPEEVQKTENEKTEQKTEQTKTETPTTTPVVSAPVAATPEPEVKVENCEHWYQPVFEEYTYTQEMVWGCNGCGYPLFTIENGKPVHFSDMYVHPPCETDRFDEPCVGGGFHSEIFTSAKCAKCRGDVVIRDCMFSVMGLRCIKNEILGPYEKVEEEHVKAYIKSCDCGENFVTSGANGNGLLFVTETCCYCGDVINYPQK